MKIYTTAEVLEKAKTSRAQLYRDMKSGKIKPNELSTSRTLRFTEEDVLAYVEEKEKLRNGIIEDEYMTVEEVSNVLKIHRTTLVRMCKNGKFKHCKNRGRRLLFDRKEIESLSQNGRS